MLKRLRRKQRKNNLSEEPCEVQYCAVINDRFTWHKSLDDMLSFVDEFGKNNIIHKLSMFKHQIYSLNEYKQN